MIASIFSLFVSSMSRLLCTQLDYQALFNYKHGCKWILKRGVTKRKLTLFGVWRHLFHERDEVEQELGVVVGQFQIIAILPGEQTRHLQVKKKQPCHATSSLHSTATHNIKWICRSNIWCQRVQHACLKSQWQQRENTADDLNNAAAHIGEKVNLLEWCNQLTAGCRQYMHNLDVHLIFESPVPFSVVGVYYTEIRNQSCAPCCIHP